MNPQILAGLLFASTPIALLAGPRADVARGLRQLPPRGRFELEAPLPGLPSVLLDANGDGYGVAQQTARSRDLQARILWVDGTANIARINTREKVDDLVRKAKAVGFNTIVLDVKPIVGYTLWPSKLAPKLREWKGQSLGDFDPVEAMVAAAKQNGIALFACLNAFSEGHRDTQTGLGYQHPKWQTILYEVRGSLHPVDNPNAAQLLADRPNEMPASGSRLGVFTEAYRLPADISPDSTVAVVNSDGDVQAQVNGPAARSPGVTIPSGGSALVGVGASSDYLKLVAKPGAHLAFECSPIFVPISRRPWEQVPLMVNPNEPAVRAHELALLEELLKSYDVDGVMYDDRLRYGGLNADFSDVTRSQFEKYVGEKITWPDDVFKWNLLPDLARGIVPGKWYDAWLAFRAMTLRDFVADARAVVERVRPRAAFGIYAGSSYGEYGRFGSNYAAREFEAGFRYLTPAYQKAGFANYLDFIVTGCYYTQATISEAMAADSLVGYTVEAAAQLSNRVARDEAWVYAGIALDQLKGDTAKLRNVLQAATGASQGVMVFDLSHDIERFWPVFQQAFGAPAKAPHEVPGLLAQVRRMRARLDKMGVKEPPVIVSGGSSSAGL